MRAPLMFIVDVDAVISPDPAELVGEGDSLGIPDEIMDIGLILSIDNQWGFGADLSVLMAPDSLSLVSGNADTLISGFTFITDASVIDTLSLDEAAFELLNRSPNWIQPQIRIVSSGDQPVRFLTTDTLTITIDGISASIDLSTLVSGE